MEKTRIFESNSKVQKVESDRENGDIECYDRCGRKPIHIDIDIDKEITELNKLELALLQNIWEEDEINNNSETRDTDGDKNLRRSNGICKPPELLGSVPYL